MFLLLRLFLIYHFIIWKPCVSVVTVYHRGGHKMIQNKLKKLAEELVLDATAKVTSIQPYRDAGLVKSTQYQYGTLIYEMRNRHRKMYQLFAQVVNVIEATPLDPRLDNNGEEKENNRFVMDALVEIDNLGHEILNFAAMIILHDANLYGDKSRVEWDLHFRRKNMAPAWLRLVDSLVDKDSNDPPEQVVQFPEENNQTRTGKRKNGVWHKAVPME